MPELSVVGEEDADEGQVEAQQDQVGADVHPTADAEVDATKVAASEAAATLIGVPKTRKGVYGLIRQ